jgi:hypothetical protein
MAVNQDIVDSLVVLDNTVQAQIAEATLTKEAADALVSAFNATKDYVETQLNSVDNTSDADKALSILSIAEFLKKQDSLVDGTNISTVNGVSLLSGIPLVIERGATSLRTLPYESRGVLRSPAAPLPVADDSVVIEFIGQFIYVESISEPDEDETCFTAVHPDTAAPIGQWLLNLPHPDYLNASNLFKDSILNDYIEYEETRITGYTN